MSTMTVTRHSRPGAGNQTKKQQVRIRSRFVEDLVPYILESYDHWWPRDYLRLALVSRAWLCYVRRRLYAHPHLSSFTACTLLARTLNANPVLASLVQGLTLAPVTRGSTASAADAAGLRRLLAIEGLTTLSLGGELAVNAERFLGALTSPQTIRELSIDGSAAYSAASGGFGSGRCAARPASLEWSPSTAFRFRALQKFSLAHLELDIMHTPMAYPFHLQELSLEKVDIVGGFLPNLARGAWGHLHTLRVVARSADELDEHVRLTIDACAPHLARFAYDVRDVRPRAADDDAPGLFDAELEPLPALRELHLSGVQVTPEVLSVLGQRCTALETLAVRGSAGCVQVDSRDWAAMLRARAWPKLRMLALAVQNGAGTEPPVRQACAERGIQMVLPYSAGDIASCKARVW